VFSKLDIPRSLRQTSPLYLAASTALGIACIFDPVLWLAEQAIIEEDFNEVEVVAFYRDM
jgi:hypothetical protein